MVKRKEAEAINSKEETFVVRKVNPVLIILTFAFLLVLLCGLCAFCGSLPFFLG